MRAMLAYVVARLREPGTMRSLIWVCMSVAGYSATDIPEAEMAMLTSGALGILSAALPEPRK